MSSATASFHILLRASNILELFTASKKDYMEHENGEEKEEEKKKPQPKAGFYFCLLAQLHG